MATKVLKVGVVKTASKFCSRVRKESVSSMGRLPCLGVLLRPQRPRQVAKKSRGSRSDLLLSNPSPNLRNKNSELVKESRSSHQGIGVWRFRRYNLPMSTPSERKRPQAHQPTLFESPADPSAETPPATETRGRPRLRMANREQIVFHAAPLDALLPQNHPARIVWAYVEGLDLTSLYDRIQSVERGPGRAPIDPKILMSLWLYATIEGIGSARQLDELCREHSAFQWIAGDVSTNYHTLADFRTDHVELLDDLLTKSVATLLAED